jgi:N-hydroxyarylamine O-acetyltransferase
MDIQKYFERINFMRKPKPDIQTLRVLHLMHLLNIPFENLDIQRGEKIILDPELLYRKIVVNNRGGFCYEMNGLFYEVLIAIGFKAKMVAARVYDGIEPGPDFDHMAVIVTINNEGFLADVGFGESFLEPLKIDPGLAQIQYNRYYKINIIDEENYKVALSEDGENFSNMYRFSPIQRKLSDFVNMCNYHQSSPQSHFTGKRMCTLARTDGRITLSGLKLIETKNGSKTETILNNEIEFDEKLKDMFGIILR